MYETPNCKVPNEERKMHDGQMIPSFPGLSQIIDAAES
jgi:hypothetical protein